MKHLKLFFALFAMLALGVGNAWAAEATIYTSNVDLSNTGGTKATASKAKISSVDYNAMKLGSSGTAGNFYVTIPANTTTLTLHAAAWNNKTFNSLTLSTETAGVTISPSTAQTLTANSGVSGNSTTYTITPNNTKEFFTYTITGATSGARIKLACSERCLIWGVNAETSGATPPTPSTTYTIKWHTAKGVTTDVTLNEGATITKPATDPTMTGYKFMGWTDQCNVATDGAGFTAISNFGTADSDKDFYAVFAVAETTGGGGTTTETLKGSDLTYSGNSGYVAFTATTASGTWSGKANYNTGGYIQINTDASNYHIGSPTFAGNVESVKITTTNNSATNRTFYIRSSNTTAQPTSGDLGSYKTTAANQTFTIDLTADANQFYIYSSGAVYISQIDVTYGGGSTSYNNYITTCSGSTPVETLTDAQFAWSAATAEATMGASNTFPTLTNTLPVSVTYESSTPATATIVADGTITLVAPGTTTISAKFAGGEVSGTTYAAKTVKYDLTVLKAPATPTSTVYIKTTNAVTDGEYLIVYEDAASTPSEPVIFDGSLATLDAAGNMKSVTISGNVINGDTEIDAATFTISTMTGGYAIKSKSGKYIGRTSSGNGMNTGASEILNIITITDGKTTVSGSGDGASTSLQYYSVSGSERFRYYGSNQKPIALYKKASSHTLTYGTCTNGSVSADVADGATVLSGTTITLSNTPSPDYKLSAYDVYKTDDAAIKVTVNGNTFVMPEYDVTISATFVPAKTLTSIEITTPATQKTFWQGETFNYTGLEVTAHFDGADDEVVTPTVTGSTATAGTQTVTVSFTEGTVTESTSYEITVKAIPNTKETAYTVAEAYDIIDKLENASGVFISGIISQVDSYNSTYKSITYWISSDGTTTKQLQVYSGKGLESADFTAVTDVAKGAQVIVCGNLKKHNTTYEFDYNNYLAAYTAPTKAEPGIAYETTEYTANVNEAFTAPTLTNPNGLTVAYSTSDATLATVNATTGAVTIGNKTGKVTITATFAGNDTYLYGTASYNITISDPSISEATFVAGTDKSEELSISKNGVTVEFTGGTFNRDDNYRCYANKSMTISYNDGQITKIVLAKSSDNSKTPSNFTTEQGTYAYAGSEGVWTGEAKSVTFETTTQVQMNTITVYYKQDTRTAAGLEWSSETINLTVGDAFTAPTFSNPNSLTVSFNSNNTALATVSSTGVVSLNAGVTGTAVITASYEGDATYKDAAVTCTITVNPKTEKVVILAQYNGEWYALQAAYFSTYTNRLAAIPVNYVGGKLYNVEEGDKATIEWQLAVSGTKATFKNGENYLTGANGTDLKLGTATFEWDYNGELFLTDGDSRTFIYHKDGYFRNYATSNAIPNSTTYSNKPVVTAPVYATGDAYSRSTTAGKFGTICLPFGSNNYTGAEFYELVQAKADGVVLASVTTLVAGTPYIFLASATEVAVYGDGTTAATPGDHNGLHGTFTDGTVVAANDDNHILLNNELRKVAETCWVNAYRAYIVMSEVPTDPVQQMPGRKYIGMDVNGENEATGLDNITTGAEVVKTIENGQLIIIRGGEKFNAQGVRL